MKMTGKILLAAATVVGLSGSAMAADLYTAPAQPAPVVQAPAATDWDGPYIGATVGYGWGTASNTTGSAALTGGFVGGQVGYNFHLTNNIVAGIEGDLNWNNGQGAFPTGDNFRINWDGSVRARVGADLDGIMPYVEGGVAFANATDTPTVGASASNTHTGWTAGAGLEFKITDPLSANVEYRYTDYGSQTYNGNSTSLTDNSVRVGLNYHF